MIPHIQAALERRLLLMPAMPTAFENSAFKPEQGVAYQRVFHLINKPNDMTLGLDAVEQKGFMQVSLFYPLDQGRVPAITKAQAVATHFKPPLTLTESGVRVLILGTAQIAQGTPDGDRWHVPVSIPWRAFITN